MSSHTAAVTPQMHVDGRCQINRAPERRRQSPETSAPLRNRRLQFNIDFRISSCARTLLATEPSGTRSRKRW